MHHSDIANLVMDRAADAFRHAKDALDEMVLDDLYENTETGVFRQRLETYAVWRETDRSTDPEVFARALYLSRGFRFPFIDIGHMEPKARAFYETYVADATEAEADYEPDPQPPPAEPSPED